MTSRPVSTQIYALHQPGEKSPFIVPFKVLPAQIPGRNDPEGVLLE
jgi:hypothetical protein